MSELKHLGIMIDQRLNFKLHVECAAIKAYNRGVLIAIMLLNIGSPRPSRHFLFQFQCGKALKKKVNRRKIQAHFKHVPFTKQYLT